jgi:allophanate hydrolase subunit 2
VAHPGDEAPPLALSPAAVRLAPGPRADWFEPQEIQQRLFGSSWLVGADSNRIGVRLHGPALRRRTGRAGATAELPSEPTLPGAIQIPPDGQPIVLGPDAPVTGGYPVIAVVLQADQDLLAQLRPGAELRFRAVRTAPGWPF